MSWTLLLGSDARLAGSRRSMIYNLPHVDSCDRAFDGIILTSLLSSIKTCIVRGDRLYLPASTSLANSKVDAERVGEDGDCLHLRNFPTPKKRLLRPISSRLIGDDRSPN